MRPRAGQQPFQGCQAVEDRVQFLAGGLPDRGLKGTEPGGGHLAFHPLPGLIGELDLGVPAVVRARGPAQDAVALEPADNAGYRAVGQAHFLAQVRRLSRANWYAWLKREEDTYVQAGLGPSADAPEGKYSLEYREGSPEQHYRAFVDNLNDIAAAFTGFASGEDGWKSARNWSRLWTTSQ
jgi:hypothetical protein